MRTLFTTLLLSTALLAGPTPAGALESYKCTSADDAADVFPVLISAGKIRVATSMGSPSFFDLEKIPAPELNGWPVYDGGVYYRGGNDLWVIFAQSGSLKILEPLRNLPAGESYTCARTL